MASSELTLEPLGATLLLREINRPDAEPRVARLVNGKPVWGALSEAGLLRQGLLLGRIGPLFGSWPDAVFTVSVSDSGQLAGPSTVQALYRWNTGTWTLTAKFPSKSLLERMQPLGSHHWLAEMIIVGAVAADAVVVVIDRRGALHQLSTTPECHTLYALSTQPPASVFALCQNAAQEPRLTHWDASDIINGTTTSTPKHPKSHALTSAIAGAWLLPASPRGMWIVRRAVPTSGSPALLHFDAGHEEQVAAGPNHVVKSVVRNETSAWLLAHTPDIPPAASLWQLPLAGPPIERSMPPSHLRLQALHGARAGHLWLSAEPRQSGAPLALLHRYPDGSFEHIVGPAGERALRVKQTIANSDGSAWLVILGMGRAHNETLLAHVPARGSGPR